MVGYEVRESACEHIGGGLWKRDRPSDIGTLVRGREHINQSEMKIQLFRIPHEMKTWLGFRHRLTVHLNFDRIDL